METVRFYDSDTGKVVNIPAAELAPGAVQAQVSGIDGVVWLLAEKLKINEFQHPPFGENVRAYIRRIQEAFAEHRPLSFEEWEDGFRRDLDPGPEIGIWHHAATVYTELSADESSPERRKAICDCIFSCMLASPDTIWRVYQPSGISKAEAQAVIDRFYTFPGDE